MSRECGDDSDMVNAEGDYRPVYPACAGMIQTDGWTASVKIQLSRVCGGKLEKNQESD